MYNITVYFFANLIEKYINCHILWYNIYVEAVISNLKSDLYKTRAGILRVSDMSENIYNEVEVPFAAKHPPVTEHFLERPAVENLLKNAFEKPLTVVTAGAGYGKTQAVLAALKSTKYKSAWMQLSEMDNLVARFWERIAYAIEPQNRSLFESLISLGYPEMIAAFDQFLRLLERELTLKEPFIFVFDDFHLIHNKTILSFFERFISARIQKISIVLISRTNPDLSLTDMLSKGLLARITQDDLRFSRDEMDAYFHKQGFGFSESMSSEIYSYTDGWILAIYLVGLATRKRNIDNQSLFLETKIDIFDLIEKEIFRSASKELQNFLIKASILDDLPVGLLKELVHNDLALISEMKKSNLLIRYDSFSDSCHFHRLFKKFLLERKGWMSEDEISEIHLLAAEWYLKNDHRPEALIHYKECGRYDEIFNIILSFNYHVVQETADLFIKLIEQAPDQIIMKRPIMRIVRANLMFNNNRIEEARQELLRIRSEYEAAPITKENLAILGEAFIVLGLISIVKQDYEFEELFKRADQCLPNGSRLVDQKLNIADGLNVCSIKDSSPGELKRHQDALFNVAPYAFRVMNGCGYGMEYLNAAESSLYTGDLKDAEKNAYEAIYRSRQYRQYDIEYMANFVLVRIFTSKGKYKEISDILDQMQNELGSLQDTGCISLNDIIRGWFYVKIEKTDKVAKWIKDKEGIPKILAPVILGREYLVRSDYLLAENRYYELLAFMEHTDQIYGARGILYATIQNKIARAIIYHYMGNYSESMDALYEAYELAYPNNLTMQFIEYGNKMRTLIYAARLNENCKISKEWLNYIYTKASAYAKQLSQIAFNYDSKHALVNIDEVKLSKRESEVLTYLSRGLTRAEIAESCYLSHSTINSIIKNIFNKLGATNIADAVRIAKEENLI